MPGVAIAELAVGVIAPAPERAVGPGGAGVEVTYGDGGPGGEATDRLAAVVLALGSASFCSIPRVRAEFGQREGACDPVGNGPVALLIGSACEDAARIPARARVGVGDFERGEEGEPGHRDA